MSRIDVSVVATGNFGQLEAQLARLKAQVATLNQGMASTSAFGPSALAGMQQYIDKFNVQLQNTGMFQTRMVSLTSETEKFGQSLQRGNLRLGQYFQTATGHIRNQQTQIQRLAREQVRLANSTTLAMGDGKAMVITPRGIDEAIHKQQILNQEYRIFRQVVAGGSTQLINWGKNTQWAGRQLTVGLTVPLTMFGVTAAKVFMDVDKQLTRMTKVYGDATKGMTDTSQLEAIRQQTVGLAQELARTMGVAASETAGMAADIAATGKTGNELLGATAEAMRLSVLGEVDRQDAMKATIAIQSVFRKDTQGLSESINFLNAVENQTSTTTNDLVTGIVKAGPVVQGLGGSIEDLALMMVAMREGGVQASEAANAIKSSLGALINPTKQTSDVLKGFGVDLKGIVDANAGDVIGTLTDLQAALGNLDDLSKQRAIEQIFGKFQFSRMNALLNNLNRAGSQTQQVLEIAGMSAGQLAQTADQELKIVTDSVSGRFQRAMESMKANLIPVGEMFTKVGTMILEVGSKILEIFNNLPDPIKSLIQGLLFLTGLAGPLIMIAGVFGNFLGYIVKGISSLMAFKTAGRGMFEYFTPESIAAKNASELVTKALYDESTAVSQLAGALEQLNLVLANMSQASAAAAQGMGNVAAKAAAAAEASALVQTAGTGSLLGYAQKAVKQVGGFERSHLSIIPKETYESGTQSSATLLPTTKEFQTASQYQGAMAQYFNPSFYDPNAGKSRQDILTEMAIQSGQTVAQGAAPKLTDIEAQRLLPTKAEYTKSVSEYFAGIRVLNEKGLKQTVKDMNAAIESGDFETVEKLLKDAIADNQQAYDQYVQEEYNALNKVSGDLQEARAYASQREMQIAPTKRSATEVTTTKGGKRLASAIYAASGGGVAGGPEIELDAVMLQRIKSEREVIEANARLAATGDKFRQITEKELQQRNKNMSKVNVRAAFEDKQGQRFALIGNKWYQVSANRVRLLTTENTKDANLIKALTERTAAERQVTRASIQVTAADQQEAASSRKAAAADELEAVASTKAAQANLMEAGSSKKAGGGIGGFLKGGKGMGALGVLGAATMMIPTGPEDSGVSQGINAAANIAGMASMGAMAGPIGAAVGAGVGIIVEGFSFFNRRAEEAAAALAKMKLSAEALSGTLLQSEQDLLAVDLKSLSDLPLSSFGQKTQEASARLDQFTEALKAAEAGTVEKATVDEIAAMQSGSEFVNSPLFKNKVIAAAMAGAKKEDIGLMIQGYLNAANKQGFAVDAVEALNALIPSDATIAEIGSNYVNNLSKIAQGVIDSAAGTRPKQSTQMGQYLSEQNKFEQQRAGREFSIGGQSQSLLDLVQGAQANPAFSTAGARNLIDLYKSGTPAADIVGGLVPGATDLTNAGLMELQINGEAADPDTIMQVLEAITSITEKTPDINVLADDINKVAASSKDMATGLSIALSNLSGLDFAKFTKDLDVSKLQAGSPALIEFANQLKGVPEYGQAAADSFTNMVNSGIDAGTAMKALKLATLDTSMSIEQLASLARDPITFDIYYNQVISGVTAGGFNMATPTAGGAMPTSAVSSAISAMGGVATADVGGGGGGGSVDTSQIEAAYDKQIAKQDKLIEGIKKQREERQKVLDLEKEAFDFAMQEQDLKNQIARARAAGNTAEAAMLQAQLDNSRAANKEKENERRRQEIEDRRIELAGKKKEALEAAKKTAVDAAKGADGGGGGGGAEGISQAVADAMKTATMDITAFTNSAQFQKAVAESGAYTAFFDGKQIAGFRKEMEKLGVPAEQINAIINELFDSFIMGNEIYTNDPVFAVMQKGLEDMGLSAEDVSSTIPDAFAIIKDSTLTAQEKLGLLKDQFIDLGYTAPEAQEKAEDYLNYILTNSGLAASKVDEITLALINSGNESDVAQKNAKKIYDVLTSNTTAKDKLAEITKLIQDSGIDAQTAKQLAKGYVDSLGIPQSTIDSWNDLARAKARSALAQGLDNLAKNNPSIPANRIKAMINDGMMDLPFAEGGFVSGRGTSQSDSIAARLSNGEFVIKASSVAKYGVPFLAAINEGMLPAAARGGLMSKYPSVAGGMRAGGYVINTGMQSGLLSGDNSQYNINVNVEGSNSSADEIANKIMQSIDRRNKMNQAGIRL